MASDLWIIVDLDGTLVDSSHRTHLAPKKACGSTKEDWEAFEHVWYLDTPHDDVFQLLRALGKKFKIAIVTSRHERRHEDTAVWLMEWGVHYDELHMREEEGVASSTVKGSIITKQFLEKGRTILFALEDDASVVSAYQWIGVNVFHVNGRR